MAELRVALCQPEHVHIIWPHVRFKLKRAIDKIGMEPFHITEDGVLSGQFLLWIGYDLEKIHAGLATQVTPDKVCTIVAFGGSRMRELLPFLRQIEFYHRNLGCKAMRIIGRKGWTRILPDYKHKATIIERPL